MGYKEYTEQGQTATEKELQLIDRATRGSDVCHGAKVDET